ncbi:glycosyltransferase [Flavobacterium daemonense]|uniref:glycosyltransferase n=1 Tax=Flavobacterium daemonense TaxID=1393049 RepID=UPI0011847684|nr:glycosyltransferase [Flavobacterium daemonense]KAF2336554.1 glycosyltransferase family 4 protein [Flavobacterium daemonense]
MKVLYFYPENPLNKTQGNNARALKLLEYFRDRNVTVDFVSIPTPTYNEDEINKLKEQNLISKGFLLPMFIRKKNQIRYLFFYSLPSSLKLKIGLYDRTRLNHVKAFNAILKANEYDIILISYIYWSKLVKNSPNIKNTKLMIDTHDFLTSQFQKQKRFKLGRFFQKEIEILSRFDKILVISPEEKYLFSQFIDKEIALATHALPSNKNSKTAPKYDLVYVASDNDHNINGANWFFSNVYPLLSKSIKIAVIGKINKHIGEFANVEKISFIEDLNDVYRQSKIAICPMLSGTGIKIKVIEALSFGIPVVCNERGLDGLLNKTNNGCLVSNNPNEFAGYIHQLLNDENFYNTISSEATSFFDKHHSIEANYKALDEAFGITSNQAN